jgi:hypothetical protein
VLFDNTRLRNLLHVIKESQNPAFWPVIVYYIIVIEYNRLSNRLPKYLIDRRSPCRPNVPKGYDSVQWAMTVFVPVATYATDGLFVPEELKTLFTSSKDVYNKYLVSGSYSI